MMHKWSFSVCLAAFLFGGNVCHAQTDALPSASDMVVEKDGETEALNCDGWEKIANDHWNKRVYRLQWKYPDAPYFGDLPEEVKAFLVSKYCVDGVDWVSENPQVVRDMMEWKWPVNISK